MTREKLPAEASAAQFTAEASAAQFTAEASAAQFDALADAWEAHVHASRASSNPLVYVEHPSFDAIVALGRDVVPLIIERYREGSLFWGAALARITGDTQFGDGVSGNLKDTRAKWLAWAAPRSASW